MRRALSARKVCGGGQMVGPPARDQHSDDSMAVSSTVSSTLGSAQNYGRRAGDVGSPRTPQAL